MRICILGITAALLIANSSANALTPPAPTEKPADTASPDNPHELPPATGDGADSDGSANITAKPSSAPRKPPAGLLTPITEEGGLPPIFNKLYGLTEEEIAYRGRVRNYAKQIRLIRHKHLGDMRVPEIREAGIEQLMEFTDPAAFRPMIQELAREKDDVRLAVLDHFAKHGETGQAALAWTVIYDPAKDAAIQNEALRRLTLPASEPVKVILDGALRSREPEVANAAAIIVNTLDILEAIPLLIFAQATGDAPEGEGQGDLAWIATQTQTAFVSGLVPVVGDNAGAFQPIISRISDGSVLRVVDAVVIQYRTIVHQSLVNLTTEDWGQPTDHLGYNIQEWWKWYNTEYVPYKNEQLAKQKLSEGE